MNSLQYARQVADAVLYEGYLLYPYRATSGKNHSRWQFGVLGPPKAAAAAYAEDPAIRAQLLVRSGAGSTVTARFRCLQLQSRTCRKSTPSGEFETAEELVVGDRRWLTWDEAVEQESSPSTWPLNELGSGQTFDVVLPAGEDVETIRDLDGIAAGELVRRRRELHATLSVRAEPLTEEVMRLSVSVVNVTSDPAENPAAATAASFIGAHLLLSVDGGEFVSMTDPPDDLAEAAGTCTQHRCWPVLAGPTGDSSLVLVSPIILYDHPQVAEQSAGALFDSTEIDEILTLRVMTMTDEEKATARATDVKAAEIIDRCDAMSPEAMQQLHGALRNPHAVADEPGDPFLPGPPDAFGNDLSGGFGFDGEVPWWDPAVDGSVDPHTDSIRVQGVDVAAGSVVRLNPTHRADAQDIFFAGQLARVAAVHTDVDGDTHVAVVLVDDPAADMHDAAGRYLHFAPDEIDPRPTLPPASVRPN